jgi:hypothetical protein
MEKIEVSHRDEEHEHAFLAYLAYEGRREGGTYRQRAGTVLLSRTLHFGSVPLASTHFVSATDLTSVTAVRHAAILRKVYR